MVAASLLVVHNPAQCFSMCCWCKPLCLATSQQTHLCLAARLRAADRMPSIILNVSCSKRNDGTAQISLYMTACENTGVRKGPPLSPASTARTYSAGLTHVQLVLRFLLIFVAYKHKCRRGVRRSRC